MSSAVADDIIGGGKISGLYLKNLGGRFASVRVKAVADLVEAGARAHAEAHPGGLALSIDVLLADGELD